MRTASEKGFKYVYELCEININQVYHDAAASVPEVGSIGDADKNFIFARYHMIDAEYMVAVEYFELAESLYIAHGDEVALALLYSQKAHCFRRLNDREKAREFTDKSIAISERLGDAYCLINSYIHAASNAFFMEDKESAHKYNAMTEPLLMESGSELQYGHYYHNVAFAFYFDGDYRNLVEYCQKAYDAYIEYYGNDTSRNVLIAAHNKAGGYVLLEEYDSAFALYEYVIRVAEEQRNIQILMNSLMDMAELYYKRGDYERAYYTYKQYLENYRTWLEERLRNPGDENEELKRKLEIAQDLEMVKSAEYIEKRRFLEQLLSSQKFVQEVGSQLIPATDIQEIFIIVCNAAKRLFMYDNISLGLIEGDELVIHYLDSEDERDRRPPIYIPLTSEEHITAKCLREERDIKLDTFEDFLELIRPADVEEAMNTKDDFNESLMFVRLIHEGKAFGVITVQKKEPNMYSDESFAAIRAMGSFVSIAINNVFKTQLIEDKVKELEVITLRDELTWLENRRSYNLYVEELVRENIEYMLIFADMNHLKQINDGIGHHNGDLYLIAVADILKDCVRDYRKFRLSGDEFAVIIPHPSIEYTYELIEQIKQECAKMDIGEYPLAIAVGCGIRNRDENPDKVFSIAEARMYLDKHDYHKHLLAEMNKELEE